MTTRIPRASGVLVLALAAGLAAPARAKDPVPPLDIPAGGPGAYVIERGRTVKADVNLLDRDLEIRGTVAGSVTARRGRISVLKGGIVQGSIRLGEGAFANIEPGGRVHLGVERIDSAGGASVAAASPEPPATPEPRDAPEAPRPLPLRHGPGFGEWVAAQVFVVLFGLLFALLALTLAPRATTLAAAILDSEPIRCLVVGAMGLAGLGVLNVVNGLLFYTVIWIPAGMVLAVLSGLVVVFSTLLGVAFLGGAIGRRLGWKGLSFYGRTATGLVALGILNCIPVVNLGSLAAQTIAPVLGLGALIITGFGRDRDWLSTRLADAGRAFHEDRE